MKPGRYPKVTFGIIVLNGEPFCRYCLRALYPFAHEIIVVEGSSPAAAGIARSDGHSRDGTLETLRELKASEDPENKLTLVTAEDDGHATGVWPGEKDEQSQAYARRATGDYLWQVDIDEFYHPRDVRTVLRMLRADPGITAVSFRQITFWGGFDYTADGWYLRRGAGIYHRLFKWRPGYRYVAHRPPTVHDGEGRDLRTVKWIDGRTMARRGVVLYHYSLLFPKQVRDKCDYYDRAPWIQADGYREWAENDYFGLRNSYRVHNVYSHPSWLNRFTGSHPPAIRSLRSDIELGRVEVEMRRTDDTERLLRSPVYRIRRAAIMALDYPARCRRRTQRIARRLGLSYAARLATRSGRASPGGVCSP